MKTAKMNEITELEPRMETHLIGKIISDQFHISTIVGKYLRSWKQNEA